MPQTKKMNQPSLKKPFGVYFIAVMFILAPLGNLLISFSGSGLHNWYEPFVLKSFLSTVTPFDWSWLLLLVVSGIMLFRPHKLSWTLAISTLLIVLGINSFRLYNVDPNSIQPEFLKVFAILSFATTAAVLVIAFYFRFPYLDRRADWFKNIERYKVQLPVVINGQKYITESISLTGCKLIVPENSQFQVNQSLMLHLSGITEESREFEIKAEVRHYRDTNLSLEFTQFPHSFVTDLDQYFKKTKV